MPNFELIIKSMTMKTNRIILFSVLACVLAGCQDKVEYEVRTDVQNKAFYKDLFMDTGMHMSSYRTMPVIDYLSLDYEYFFAPEWTDENQAIQSLAYCGSEEDENGVLLYPDGQPRFKLIYVNGGLASSHGRSLMAKGRNNYRQFVREGGSYIGSCAGAFLASYGLYVEGRTRRGYLGIWPGLANNTGFTDDYSYDIPAESPVLQYYDLGGDNSIEKIHHENGPFFSQWQSVEGTEVLTLNKAEGHQNAGQPGASAYKENVFSGRVIPSGEHPEQVPDGEVRDLMAAYVRYALDGTGVAKAKAALNNGETVMMDKSTGDRDPQHTMIGDKQCHHFVFALPKGATDVCIRLESLKDCNLSLFLADGTFAFRDDAKYKVENAESVKELAFDSLEEGLWYVGVQSEETVECEFGEHGYVYSGKTWLLNGAPYSISVSWNRKSKRVPSVKLAGPEFSGNALLATGADFNEYLKQLIDPKARVSNTDSTITKIVFCTGNNSTEGVRVDDIRSSVPVYASIDDKGTVTVTTPANEIVANADASFMFADFLALTSVENLAAVRTSGTKYFNEMFSGSVNFVKVDSTALFDMSKAETTGDMFLNCKDPE